MSKKEAKGREKWNVPDWRDSTAYPTPNELSDTLWRWEFLRRRTDYRQDWERYYPQTYEFNVACSKDPKPQTGMGKVSSLLIILAFWPRCRFLLKNIIFKGCPIQASKNLNACRSFPITAKCT